MVDRTDELRDVPEARPADVRSPADIVLALYQAISGPGGEARDEDRIRSLFDPRARLLITRWRNRPQPEEEVAYEWDVTAFLEEGWRQWMEDGFWEAELVGRTERFGNVAHVLSSYESRIGSPDSAPVVRGVNSVQLIRHGGRWWIEGIVWDLEGPDNPLPPELVGSIGGTHERPLREAYRAGTGDARRSGVVWTVLVLLAVVALGLLGVAAFALLGDCRWIAARNEALAARYDLVVRRVVGASRRAWCRFQPGRRLLALLVAGCWLSLFLGAGLEQAYGAIPAIHPTVWLAVAAWVSVVYLLGAIPPFVRTLNTPLEPRHLEGAWS